jgi:PAS domain S-box-containing protein
VDLTLIFHIFSTIGFGLALLLAFRIQKNLLGHPSRIFLSIFLLIYFLVGVSNVLKHGGVTNYFDRFEYFAEILFPPAFLFFIFPIFSLYIFTTYMKQDFEKRMEIEESLIESEKKFRNLSEEIADGVAVIIAGKIKWVNKAFPKIFGFEYHEVLGMDIDSLIQPIKPHTSKNSSLQNNPAHHPLETRYETMGYLKDGNKIAIGVSEKPITFDNRSALQIVTRDITERKLAQEEINRAKMEWEQTFNTVPDMITILDSTNKILRVNKSMAEYLNSSQDELVGKNFHMLVHGKENPGALNSPKAITSNHEEQTVEIYEERPNEHYLVSISPLHDDRGNYIGSVRVSHNITELKQVQNELEATRSFLQSIIDGVTESIMVIDKDYRIRLINEASIKQHKIDQPFSEPLLCYQVTHQTNKPCHGDGHPCPLKKVLETKQPISLIHKHKHADGSEYAVEIGASPIIDKDGGISGIIEVGRDITEKLRLEKEEKEFRTRLFQQQKDQSIALIAKGIAHDFNNLLGTVIGNVDLLQMGTAPKEDECGIVEAIGSAAHRMSDLTTQLLAYAKGGTYKLERLVMNPLILQTLKFSHTGEALKLKISHNLAKDIWPILGDPNQMKQMLVNILTNAFEAMEEKGGTLTVETKNVIKKTDWQDSFNNVHPQGSYVSIDISNTGPEIPGEISNLIFEPFYTTKSLGRGLGLAAVAGIVQNHGGCVSFESSEAAGTTFHILLPKSEAEGNNSGNEILHQTTMTSGRDVIKEKAL